MNAFSRKGARGRFTTNKGIVVLAALLLITIVLAVVTFVHVARWDDHDEQYLLRAKEQQIISQRIVKEALAAAEGDDAAFDRLGASRDGFGKIMGELKDGEKRIGLPPSPAEVAADLERVEDSWREMRQGADKILNNRKPVLTVRRLIDEVTSLVPKLEEQIDGLVRALVGSKAPREQIYLATRQLMLAQRIENNVARVLEGGQVTAAAIDRVSRDRERFARVLKGLLRGEAKLNVPAITERAAVQKLRTASTLFKSIDANIEKILAAAPDVLPALHAANDISLVSDTLNDASRQLIDAYGESPGRFSLGIIEASPVLIAILGALAVFFLVMLGVQLLIEAFRRETGVKEHNERNQTAILRLLDEMGDLADGDLTVTATVTEDITGAIADSINYAIEQLRNLVVTINDTSEKVSTSTQETRATAMHLAEASELQAEQITMASSAIKEMTQAIDEMSSDAIESAEVAQRSVEIASNGAATVRNTIQGMDAIREQIQETSKRIKRLGESSQEIGNIVELIDDIADQTNILALNAAMQAAMAGESGRGFAVVADEVQRLAERSSNATKQIEALVQTIQADTSGAISSMESSTTGVVSGAKLAEDAGEALREIENVSNYIADLTGKIASSARKQSLEAVRVDDTMGVIQEITTQTSDGTNQTASAIGKLAALADDLQSTVAGFRIPE